MKDCQFGVSPVNYSEGLRLSAHNFSSSVGSISIGPEIVPLVWHILSWKNLSSADLRRAICQLLMNEWVLTTGKLPLGGLTRNSLFK